MLRAKAGPYERSPQQTPSAQNDQIRLPSEFSKSFNHERRTNNPLDSSHHHLSRRLRTRNLWLHGRHAQDPVHRATKVHGQQLRVNDGETPSMGSPRDTRRSHSNRHAPNNPRGRRRPNSCGHQNHENYAFHERRNGANQRLPATLPQKRIVFALTHRRGQKDY